MAKSSSSGKWAAGAVVAGVAGFVAGILTAPKSGKQTRLDIKNAAVKAKSEAEKNLKSLNSELNTKLADAKLKGNELTGKAKDEYDVMIEKAKKAKEKVRDVLSAMHDGNPSDPELKNAQQDAKDALKHLEKFEKKS